MGPSCSAVLQHSPSSFIPPARKWVSRSSAPPVINQAGFRVIISKDLNVKAVSMCTASVLYGAVASLGVYLHHPAGRHPSVFLLPVRFGFIHISLNWPVAPCEHVLFGRGIREGLSVRRRGNWCSAKVWDPLRSQGGNRICFSHRHNKQGSIFPSTGGLLEDFITVEFILWPQTSTQSLHPFPFVPAFTSYFFFFFSSLLAYHYVFINVSTTGQLLLLCP